MSLSETAFGALACHIAHADAIVYFFCKEAISTSLSQAEQVSKQHACCRLHKDVAPIRGHWRCQAADSDVATQDEIEAMEDGAVAVPADPAGTPITGGHPPPGAHRGEPAGKYLPIHLTGSNHIQAIIEACLVLIAKRPFIEFSCFHCYCSSSIDRGKSKLKATTVCWDDACSHQLYNNARGIWHCFG